MDKYGRGQPPHKPDDDTRQTVCDLSSNGATQPEIAAYLDISDETLRKYYREELDQSRLKKTVKIGKLLYERALGGEFDAQVFWLKTQGRWHFARPPEESAVKEAFLAQFLNKDKDA